MNNNKNVYILIKISIYETLLNYLLVCSDIVCEIKYNTHTWKNRL